MSKTQSRQPTTTTVTPQTFAIDGLTEYMLRLPVGATHIDYHFKGGMLSGYGVRPAILTLSDPIAIRVLEASRQFKNRLIRKLER